MEKFIHEENLKRYRELLAMQTDLEKRKQIEYLITEELGKAPRPRLGKTMK
jgi:hypothetical protein